MIRDLLQKERVMAKLAAGRKVTANAASALDRKHKGAIKMARKYGISAKELKELLPVIDRALRSAKKEKSNTGFMPRDPESAMLLAALEDFYRELDCLASPRKRLVGQPRDPLSDQLLAKDPLAEPERAPELAECRGA